MSKYYRITYKEEGIYNALKNKVGHEMWLQLLKSNDINWLPKPPEYSSNNESYFTEKGYQEFLIRTMPIILQYFPKESIKIEILNNIIKKILYSDEYQVVIEINDKEKE